MWLPRAYKNCEACAVMGDRTRKWRRLERTRSSGSALMARFGRLLL